MFLVNLIMSCFDLVLSEFNLVNSIVDTDDMMPNPFCIR